MENSTFIKLLNSLSEAVVATDVSGKVQYVNKKALELFELDQQSVLQTSYFDIISGLSKRFEFRSASNDYIELEELPLAKAIKCQLTVKDILFGVAKKSKPVSRWLRCSTEIIFNDQDPYLIVANYIDVTELVLATTKLRENLSELTQKKAFLNVLLDNLEEGIVAIDEKMQFTLFNQKALLFHNVDDPSSILGRFPTGSDLYYPNGEMLSYDDNPLIRAFNGSHIKGYHLIIAPRAGKRRDVIVNASPLKDENGNRLGAVAVMRDVTEEKKYELRLIDLALKDPLTNLANRILLIDRLNQALEHAAREGLKVGVMVIDIDNFKDINDTYGHKSGDEVLKVLARRYMSVLRPTDTVARFGGDEFVIVATVENEIELELIKSRILAVTSLPIRVKDTNCIASISLGLAVSNDVLSDEDSLLTLADSRMYEQKRLKKDCNNSNNRKFSL